MNLGDSADISPDVLDATKFQNPGAMTLSNEVEDADCKPDFLSKIVGKALKAEEIGPVGAIVTDDNVLSDILDSRSYHYADGNYQRPEDIIQFFDDLASSPRPQTPELVFPRNIIPRLRSRYGGEEYLNSIKVEEALEQLGTVLETNPYQKKSESYGSKKGDAMICYAAADFVDPGGEALVMTNDDHLQYICRDSDFSNVTPASPVYSEKIVREKGLI